MPSTDVYMDHQPQIKPHKLRMKNVRVGVFSEDRTVLIGLGNYAGEEFKPDAPGGPGMHACIHMDSGNVVYGCDVFWMPVDRIPEEIREKFGIKIY